MVAVVIRVISRWIRLQRALRPDAYDRRGTGRYAQDMLIGYVLRAVLWFFLGLLVTYIVVKLRERWILRAWPFSRR
jgi:hypothetical protein